MAESAAVAAADVAEAWDPWAPVLDELEHRVVAAESGDLAALDGWSPPAVQPRPMTIEDQQRANGILLRQRALLTRIRDEQKLLAVSMRAMRRPQYKPATPPPVYIDRVG